jgi:tetratricopeptide (TPR) repeat protein
MRKSSLTSHLVLITVITITVQPRNAFATRSDPQDRCTIIYATDGKTALAGNNEDSTNPFPIVWFQPGEDGKYGGMYFGFQDFSPKALDWHSQEGGINEKGLFYDFATTEEVEVPRDPDKPDCWPLMKKVMEECSTVDEAITLFSAYNFREVWRGHYLIGDRLGNSAIIEPFTFIRRNRKYQVATNFLLTKTDPETSADVRYRVASNLLEQSDSMSVALFRRILDDTHMEDYGGLFSVTLYSYICDLGKGDVYIYNFHNYDDVVKLNIHEELKKGEHSILISSLFNHETDAARQYRTNRATMMLIERAVQNGVAGEDGAIAFYRALRSPDDKPVKYNLEEGDLAAAGHALLRYKKVNEAIELFTFVAEEFPLSANAYDSLGEAYMKAGNKELAIENYKKSMELNPDNENAGKMLEQLQK